MFNGLTFLNKDDNNFDSFLAGEHFGSNDVKSLADIFEADDFIKSDEGENTTLKYNPPKANQPQKSNDKSTWDVVIAKIITAFKLVNDTNSPIGQLGLALLKNSSEDTAKLILYKTKDYILSTLQLTKQTTVYWKPPYLQYHDSQNGFWSLLFGTDSDSSEFFAKMDEVCTIDPANVTNTDPSNVATPVESASFAKSADSTESDKDNKTDKVDSVEPVKTKNDVVYRVAKIGHQLPRIKPSTDDSIDSTLTTDTENISSHQPIKMPYYIPEETLPSSRIPPKPTNISVALQPSVWSSSTFDLNSFASENRIQHTEVRVNLSKLDSKLDRVLDNVERLWLVSSKSNNPQDKEEEIIKLEEKVLELKKENRALKQQFSENEKLKNDAENMDKEELAILKESNEEKDAKIVELTNKIQELNQKIDVSNESNEQQKQQLINEHATEIGKLREELEQKSNELQTFQQSNNKGSNDTNGEMIRSIMNQFYVKLYQSIEGKNTLSSADILKLTAEIIRKETKAALNTS